MTINSRPPSTLNDPGLGTDPTRNLEQGYSSTTKSGKPTSRPGQQGDQPLAEAGEQVGRNAGEIAHRAADIGFQGADKGRERTADTLDELARSIRRISTDTEGQQPAIAGIASTAAEQTERLAGYLRTTDSREIFHSVEDAARRQPLLFLGGAFALGLIASRFMKAAGSDNQDQKLYGTDAYRATGPGSSIGRTTSTGEVI